MPDDFAAALLRLQEMARLLAHEPRAGANTSHGRDLAALLAGYARLRDALEEVVGWVPKMPDGMRMRAEAALADCPPAEEST